MPRGPVVYLLHFDRPLAHAKHYLGMARSLRRRLTKHQSGNGSKLMTAVAQAGIGWTLARVWRCDSLKGAYELERKLKGRKSGVRLCPACQEGR